MKKLAFVATTIMLIYLTGGVLFAEGKKEEKKAPPSGGIVTETTNIHYTGKYCNKCHKKTPVKDGESFLKFGGDFKQLCKCHAITSGSYIHPVDIIPTTEKMSRIPADFPLQNERITCLTCHDLSMQCRKSTLRETSLRGVPYPKRTDFCFKCHKKENYKKLDPHDQIDKNGAIIKETCLYCHREKPDEEHNTYKELKFIGDLVVLCQRCHGIAGNHSGNFNHMVKPSARGLKKMEAMKVKFGLILPLDEEGKMTCITCHNPHEKGVIPEDKASAKGANSKFRHRLPGTICIECHQM